MCKKPTGFYKYEEIQENVDKIIIKIDKKLEEYYIIINELKENKICPEHLTAIIIISISQEVFL